MASTLELARVADGEGLRGSARAASGDGGLSRFVSRWHLILTTKVLDIALILIVATSAYFMEMNWGDALRYMFGAAVIAIICYLSFTRAHLYEIKSLLSWMGAAKAIVLRMSLVFMGLATLAALTHQQALLSRSWFVAFYAGAIIALLAGRLFLAALMRSCIAQGFVTQHVVIVGLNELTGHLVEQIKANRHGVRIAGIFDDGVAGGVAGGAAGRDPDNLRGQASDVAELTRGGVSDLLRYALSNPVDLVVITLPIAAAERITRVIEQLRRLPLNIRILPGEIGLQRFTPMQL